MMYCNFGPGHNCPDYLTEDGVCTFNGDCGAKVRFAPEITVLYREAKNIAVHLHKHLYPDDKKWEPLDTVRGILTQIDNLVAGLPKSIPLDEIYFCPEGGDSGFTHDEWLDSTKACSCQEKKYSAHNLKRMQDESAKIPQE